MNISDETLEVLKNFASINPNIVLNPGQQIKTISEAKNIMASAEIVEDFPQEFGVYDLNEFLSVLSLVQPADLSFDDKFVTISSTGDNRSKIKYFFSEPEILTTPQKDINMPECEFGISITESVLDQIRKAAAVLGHTELVLTGDNGIITATVLDDRDSTANTFSMELDGDNECKNEFKFVINIANLKLLPGDYYVSISSKLISNWTNVSRTAPVNYFIALEKTSEFNV
tara:strand:+ start:1661 stop:2347 length:687 start_codon:yes stop_codon:yes gene_type:complete